MMSQIIMSTCRWISCVAKETCTSLFETRVPTVVMYCSSNMFITYRRTRDVFLEVDLVDRVADRGLAHGLAVAPYPTLFRSQGPSTGEVGDREDAVRAVEERLLQQVPEALLPHDVPDRDVHLELLAAGHVEHDLPFRHLRA